MNEIQIREQLIKVLAKKHPHNTEFLAELPIADFSRRIDLVMANGSLSGFEIKSEQDTLSRLDGQLETYTQYFENVTVVCATKHLKKVMCIAPDTVGVWEFDGKKLVVHRKARKNQNLDKGIWLSFLNTVGLKALLRQHKLKVSGLKSELVSRALSLPYADVRIFVLSYMKQQFPIISEDRLAYRERKLAKLREENEVKKDILVATDKALPRMPQELLDLPIRERLLAIRRFHQKTQIHR